MKEQTQTKLPRNQSVMMIMDQARSDGRGRLSRQAQTNVNNKQDLTQVSRCFESLDSELTTAHSNGDYNNSIRSAHR